MAFLEEEQEHFSDYLNRLALDPNNDIVLAECSEIQDLVDSAEGFHWGSPSLLSRRTRHLREFYILMRVLHRLPAVELANPLDFPEKYETQMIAFPNHNEKELLNNLKVYLGFSLKRLKPRKNSWTHPRYQSLIQRRQSLMHYIYQSFIGQNITLSPAFKSRVINCTNEVLQKAAREYQVNRAAKIKPYLGRLELPQLIDMDSLATANIAVAENHHLAWCIACICGVRPGSMGWANERKGQYLRWKDIQITRSTKGKFDCQIFFEFLKGNRDDVSLDKSLTMYPKSPLSTTFIPLSIPHRLLIILLRRDGLTGYPSSSGTFAERVDRLLNGEEHFIKIDEGFKHLPIFLASGPRGLELSDTPMSSGSMSDYLSRRAIRMGYGPGVTIYAFRRKAASEWTRQVGLSQAKALMSHSPISFALQKHYEQGFFDLDVTAIALREDASSNVAEMDADASIALVRLSDFTKAQGAWLDAYVERLATKSDPLQKAIADGNAAKAAKIRRRIREYGRLALMEEQKAIQAAKISQVEFEKRKKELQQPMGMFRAIEARARELENKGVDVKSFFELGVEGLEPADLRDVEDDAEGMEGDIVVDADRGPDDQNEVPYSTIAFIFMVTALEGYKIVGPDGNKEKCPLCLEDSTMSKEQKDTLWTPDNLKEHVASSTHCKKRHWLRATQQRVDAKGEDNYNCPYADCKKSYKSLSRLVRHIDTSTDDNTSKVHDDAKRDDGWYDDDWQWEPPKTYRRRKNERRSAGLIFSGELELEEPKRVKVESRFEVVRGGLSHTGSNLVERFPGLVSTGDLGTVHSTQDLTKIYPQSLRTGDHPDFIQSTANNLVKMYPSLIKRGCDG